jgi:hypothetical protein
MKTIYKMIPAIFLLAVSVSMIATFNLNQVLAQNPSNLDPTVLKEPSRATQITATQQNQHE